MANRPQLRPIKLAESTCQCRRSAFTLVELLVVISIMGILVAMLLPAVQSVRGTARRIQCANKLRQLGVALHHYESANTQFPVGAEDGVAHSWAARVLSHLDNAALYQKIDFDLAWNHPSNRIETRQTIPLFICPSSNKTWTGATDYCGISGSHMGTTVDGSRSGILFAGKFGEGIAFSDIGDGVSQTIIIAEGADVDERNNGYWANGIHCFTHDDGGVNNRRGLKEIASRHPSGAQVVFCDGSVQFLGETIEAEIVGALCTRDSNENFAFDL